ncbi:MAG TPA: phosphate acetyltransferase [Sulfuricurvum sp.]|nr:phosphate acetyltransferase [Sulfuricurvum sp.]
MKIATLFVSSNQSNSGSIVITMGLMQLVKSKIENVGFFRPIIDGLPEENHDIRFMMEYFKLAQTYDESYGMTLQEFEQYIAMNQQDVAIEIIIHKLHTLKQKKGFVLIEGIDPSHFSANLGFDINLELAKNLDSDFISIINAKHKTKEEVLNAIQIESDAIQSHGVRSFMIVVNRIPQENILEFKEQCDQKKGIYFTPEIAELERITLKDIKEQLNCSMLYGEFKDLNRVIHSKLVAAMSSDHYLERMNEKALIIVPADRCDIITATILALYSKNHPNVAGILLTGNTELFQSVQQLLLGLDAFALPILSTALDTYQAACAIEKIKAKITSNSERKIALAMGIFSDHINAQNVLDKLDTSTEHTMTPAMFEYHLFAKARGDKKTIVMPESEDERILRAAEIILRRGVANIILLGNEKLLLHRAGILGLDISQATIIDPLSSPLKQLFVDEFYKMRHTKGLQYQAAEDAMAHANYFATMLVHTGAADGMVSGAAHTTADTIRPALQIIKTKPGISIVSSVFFMCMDTEVLVYGDCAINQSPNAEELAQIAITSAHTAHAFGIEPRVAMLSYSTGDSGSGDDVNKIKAATRIAKEMDPDLAIEGPIQYDAAIDADVAILKLPHSDVAGRATVFIFPDLNTGNNTYKAVQRSSNALAIGPVLQGLNKPINDLSRGCSVTDIVNTVAITAIQAQLQS